MEDLVEKIAKVAHEANRAYCQALGDDSQPAWEDAPEWQKESARNGVRFDLTATHTTPEQSHQNWMKQKVEDGWVYGETKDPDAKTHPCLVPYEQLPTEQKAKDYLFRAIVNSMADL